MLIMLKWVPYKFDTWISPANEHWCLTDSKTSSTPLINELVDSYDVLQMPRCSSHYLGTRLWLGVSWRPTLALIRALRKHGNPALVHQLEKVLNGSSWSPLRRAAVFGGSTACPRCGTLEAGALHEYWECPCNSDIAEPAVQNTQIHITQAYYESAHVPCLWLRGILPNSLDPYIPPCVDYDKNIHTHPTDPPVAVWPGGQYFGDGSGGEHTSHPDLRRGGVGLACYDSANLFLFP